MSTTTKIKITLPESWAEVSLGQYIEISKIETKKEVAFVVELLAILCPELTKETIKSFNSDYLVKISNTLAWMSENPDKSSVNKEFKIGYDTYKYERDFNKLSFGEVVSYETLMENDKYDNNDSIALVLSIILKKEVGNKLEAFDSDHIDERIELFKKELNINEVMGLVFFFLNGEKPYSIILEDYFQQIKTLTKQMKQI